MKKIIFIFLLLLALAGFSISQATAECNIVWSGYFYLSPVSGSAPTAETSRTQQATYEAFKDMYNMEPQNWSNGCYNRHDIWEDWPCDDFYYHACQDGTWSYGQTYCAHSGSGTWDVVCTTVIELSSFTVKADNKSITLNWETESELDNAGFNILRSTQEAGPYEQINTALIPAKGSNIKGAKYKFADSSVQNRQEYFYKLEDVDTSGVVTMHGPVSATPRWILGIFGLFKK